MIQNHGPEDVIVDSESEASDAEEAVAFQAENYNLKRKDVKNRGPRSLFGIKWQKKTAEGKKSKGLEHDWPRTHIT